MGSSHSTRDDASDGVPAAPRNKKILLEKDAWKIATAWQEPLRGAVSLVVDPDGPVTSIMESYTWVAINLPTIGCRPTSTYSRMEPIDQASIARAAAVSWLALSQCPGYGGTENPRFWRKVLSGFRNAVKQIWPPKESVLFFDQPKQLAFPRFIISTRLAQIPICVFSGVPGYELQSRISKQLERLLNRLRPYLYGTRRVDVCVSVPLDSYGRAPRDERRLMRYANLVQEVNAARRLEPL